MLTNQLLVAYSERDTWRDKIDRSPYNSLCNRLRSYQKDI